MRTFGSGNSVGNSLSAKCPVRGTPRSMLLWCPEDSSPSNGPSKQKTILIKLINHVINEKKVSQIENQKRFSLLICILEMPIKTVSSERFVH